MHSYNSSTVELGTLTVATQPSSERRGNVQPRACLKTEGIELFTDTRQQQQKHQQLYSILQHTAGLGKLVCGEPAYFFSEGKHVTGKYT